jgi:hypothetical protein
MKVTFDDLRFYRDSAGNEVCFKSLPTPYERMQIVVVKDGPGFNYALLDDRHSLATRPAHVSDADKLMLWVNAVWQMRQVPCTVDDILAAEQKLTGKSEAELVQHYKRAWSLMEHQLPSFDLLPPSTWKQ